MARFSSLVLLFICYQIGDFNKQHHNKQIDSLSALRHYYYQQILLMYLIVVYTVNKSSNSCTKYFIYGYQGNKGPQYEIKLNFILNSKLSFLYENEIKMHYRGIPSMHSKSSYQASKYFISESEFRETTTKSRER